MDPLAGMSSLPVPQYITWAEGPRAHHDAHWWYGYESNGHGGNREGDKNREQERGSKIFVWLERLD